MRLGWSDYRDDFIDLVDDLEKPYQNHLKNLIFMMDFLLPLVILSYIRRNDRHKTMDSLFGSPNLIMHFDFFD